jgi:hypothetical protein
MVLLYTTVYLVFLQIFNHLFSLEWPALMAVVLISVFYIIQMIGYIRRTECIEMPVSPVRPVRDELPSLSLNDKAYRVQPSSIHLPSYIKLELKTEDSASSTRSFWRKLRVSKQLMIFPDQCQREEFHTLIRMIRLSLGR